MASNEAGVDPHRGLMMLSIHPRHARNIVNGTKTVELRKTRPHVRPGQPIAIYETIPTSAVVATCRVARIDVTPVSQMGRAVMTAACVTQRDITEYFAGRDTAYLIHLRDVSPLLDPVRLSDIRRNQEFAPPQTWHFLDRAAVDRMFLKHPSWNMIAAFMGQPV